MREMLKTSLVGTRSPHFPNLGHLPQLSILAVDSFGVLLVIELVCQYRFRAEAVGTFVSIPSFGYSDCTCPKSTKLAMLVLKAPVRIKLETTAIPV